MNTKEQGEFFTRDEAAKYLRVSTSSFSRIIKAGKLPYVRINGRALRIARQALDNYVMGVYEDRPAANQVEPEQQEDMSTWPPTPSIFEQGK